MGKNKDQVKTFLSSDFKIINNWFSKNFNNLAIKNSKEVEILGITLDRNMNFHTHIKNICRKAGQKLSALLRISLYLDQRKKVLLYKRAKRDYNSSKEFTSLNDRSIQNCKQYSTTNNEFSFSISLQHKQYKKFSRNLYRK